MKTFLIIFADGSRRVFSGLNFTEALEEAAKWSGIYSETLSKCLSGFSATDYLELLKVWHIFGNRQAVIEAAFELDAILYDEQSGYVDE